MGLRHVFAPGVLGCLVLSSACTASLDLDRFKAAATSTTTTTPGQATHLDFLFFGQDMTSHDREYFELRIIDSKEKIVTKAVYNNVIPFPEFADPRLTTTQFNIYLKGTIPKENGPYRVDFWADHLKDGAYGGNTPGKRADEKDHGWRRLLEDPLPPDVQLVDTRWQFFFKHDTNFNELNERPAERGGGPLPFAFNEAELFPAKLNVRGAARFSNTNVDIRIIDNKGRLIAFHRQGQPQDTYVATVTGVIDEESSYTLLVYADADRNGRLTASDPSWRFQATSSATELVFDVDLNLPPVQPQIETGEIEITLP